MYSPAHRSHTVTTMFGVLMLAACSDSTAAGLKIPARLQVMSGDAQTGMVTAELGVPLAVKVVDERGKPITRYPVDFRVTSGGGSIGGGWTLTGSDGIARRRWTLGTATTDSQRVEARAVGNTPGAPVLTATFRATAVAGMPATVVPLKGTARYGPVGGAVTDSLSVKVYDEQGNVVPGARVTWNADQGGTVAPAESWTGPDGIATTQWTLGLRADVTYEASAGSESALTLFFASHPGIPGDAVLSKEAGDGQIVAAGTTPLPFRVRLRLADGRPVQGASVSFSGEELRTDSAGEVVIRPYLPAQPGVYSYPATAAGGTPAVFRLTVVSARTGLVAIPTAETFFACGGNRNASSVARVQFTDPDGKLALSGATVDFTVVSGGGTVDPAQVMSDAQGMAGTSFTVGSIAGVQVLKVSSPAAASVTFISTYAEAGVAVSADIRPDTLYVSPGEKGHLSSIAKDACGNVIPVDAARTIGWSFSQRGSSGTHFTYGLSSAFAAKPPCPPPGDMPRLCPWDWVVPVSIPDGNVTVQGTDPGTGWMVGVFTTGNARDSTLVIVR